MFKKTLEARTQRVFKLLSGSPLLSNFYLAGGTSLALQFGHRRSIDLDFFSVKQFANHKIISALSKIGQTKILAEDAGTVHAVLGGVNVSFLYYPYTLIYPAVEFQNVKLADWRDIACMKLSAVSSRGSKKDFIDLFFILQKINLADLLKLFQRKYKGLNYNLNHILKSLVYFADAEKEPMPLMLIEISWPKIKNDIKRRVKAYLASQ